MSGATKTAARLTLKLGEVLFQDIISAEITRDLEEISGGFRVDVLDQARLATALPAWWRPEGELGALLPGDRAVISLDDEVVLVGWVDEVKVSYGPDKVGMTITGRDVTGDLVDCAAAPNGPAEFSNLTLTQLVTRICAPFGITVTADVPVGAPFPKFGIEPGETAMSVIEKACRQRAVLAVSDGVGGLRLTRGGRLPAPASLIFGKNITTMDATFNHAERFAEYIVKGQGARGTGGGRVLINTAIPVSSVTEAVRPPAASTAGPRPRVVMTGRATDAAVTRYRPTVSMAKAQSGGASVQEQADWKMRTARAKAENLRTSVADWRAGDDERLWRINERATVDDPLSNASAELLIASLIWRWSDPDGASTELKLCGCDAFDVLLEPGDTARRAQPRARGDNVAREFTRDQPPARPNTGATQFTG